MANNDYYDILGVSKGVGEEDIRRAFRKKAMEFHPDRNKSAGAEDKFKEINEAYQVLSDPNKRAQYDQFGKVGAGGRADQPFDGFDVFGGFGDIFDSFFGDGAGRGARQAQRGSDLQQRVVLSFEESIFGAEREVEITRLEDCGVCSGAGNEPGTSLETCSTCKGNGQVRRAQRSVFGQFTQVTACNSCRGLGTIIKTPCSNCRGGGKERKSRKIAVTIPAGVEAGMQVRLTGEGDAGSEGGGTGNLYVFIDVQEHQFFERDGSDILYDLPVNIAEAALGANKSIPTLDGKDEELELPQGTQPGTEFRIKGKGVPHLHGSRRGDLLVTVDVRVPGSLDDRQRELLEELAGSFNGSKNGNGDGADKGIFGKIKEVLG
ncbi:MAG: molecular chaperone DnaJ [Chloroflexi bacterium]|nr:molecular chaperone DnaJ [Chloroflexota bacterium]MDA1271702.1 molecular chaperone DnaJ [Chloroflexota bacterium]PKB59360.1 MAG: molecular chaperone DnaJ [SAR202 cluster bacterium Casp-Chloro-G2]